MKTRPPWRLFLDDERFPPIGWDDHQWKLARNVDDAMWYIKNFGMPRDMSLDHDLGYGKLTGMDFCKIFVGYIMDNDVKLPQDFSYYVHSQNPVGRDNMNAYLTQALKELDY